MGALYCFDCLSCGYTATISGGKDCGMFSVVRTMLCNDCKELVNVFIGVHGKEYKDLTSLEKNLRSKGIFKDYSNSFRKCPKCHKDNFLEYWNLKKRPCPNCGSNMHRKKETKLLWD